MNIFELKNTKAGMTLIEMVISLAILSVLMTSSMGMIVSSNSIFISTSKAALDKQVGNAVYSLLESVIKYSTHLQISDTADETASQRILLNVKDDTTSSGYIMYYNSDYDESDSGTATSLYDNSFYGANRTVKYKVESVGGSGKHVRITIIVCRDGEEVYKTSAIVKCLNLSLTSGSTNNAISVSDSAPEYNQVLSFTCDEMLMSGGESAWSVEYKINEYLAEYNTILNSYYQHLSSANAEVTSTYNTYKTKTGNDVITKPTLLRILNTRSTSVFGTDYDQISSAENFDDILDSKTDSISNNAKWNSKVAWSDTLSEYASWKNIRAYYQKEIFDLLKYSPRTITDTTNPYYMVIASKEELYTGFLLTYYDKDGDGEVTQAEYPNFGSTQSEIKDFFGGTTLLDYADGSVEGDSMVILAYCIDNVEDDDYQNSFFTKTTVNLECKYDIEEDRLKNAAEGGPWKWYTSKKQTFYVTTNSYSGTSWKSSNDYKDDDDGAQSQKVQNLLTVSDYTNLGYKSFNGISNSITNYANSFKAETGYKYTWKFKVFWTSVDGNIVTINSTDDGQIYINDDYNWGNGSKKPSTDQRTLYYSIDTAATSAINSLGGVWGTGARDITKYATLDTSATRQYEYSYQRFTSGKGVMYVYKANSDLQEGWYYMKEGHWGTYREKHKIYDVNPNVTGYKHYHDDDNQMVSWSYHFFLLKADYGDKTKIDGSGSMSYNKNKIAVSSGCEIDVMSNMSGYLDWYCYQRAQYVGANDEYAKVNLEFETWNIKKPHQYTDWMLYGVDWNSWFSQKTGLLNKGMTAVVTWISKFTGGNVGTISSISASNSDLSLGRVGSYSVSGVSTSSRSYNTAWMVYNKSKGTWYYLPAISTVTSSIWSGISFTSAKDTPTVLDLENDIENSYKLEWFINNRKYYSNFMETWKTNGKADVTWVPLPTSTEQVNASS